MEAEASHDSRFDNENRLKKLFLKYDTDNDGLIQIPELKELLYELDIQRPGSTVIQKSSLIKQSKFQEDTRPYAQVNQQLKALRVVVQASKHRRTASETVGLKVNTQTQPYDIAWLEQTPRSSDDDREFGIEFNTQLDKTSQIALNSPVNFDTLAKQLEFDSHDYRNGLSIPPPQQQSQIIQRLMSNVNVHDQVEVYIISRKWWRLWASFVNFDIDSVDLHQYLQPNGIDNSDIIQNSNGMNSFIKLRSNLSEIDYVVVSANVQMQLHKWYQGGPILQRFRIDGKLDVFPLFLQVGLVSESQTEFEFRHLVISSLQNVAFLKQLIMDQLEIQNSEEPVNLYAMSSNDKSPILLVYNNDELIFNTVILDGTRLLVELARSKHSRTRTTNSVISWIGKQIMTPNILSPRETGTAIVGLQNMGNTCYLAAALQCLLHTKLLVEYFDSDSHSQDLELSKRDGQLTIEFVNLLDAFYNKARSYSSLVPSSFRKILVQLSPQFNGFEQRDSQEVVGVILEHLHMDLNIVPVEKKVTAENPDYNGHKDQELADIYWRNYLKREASIVTALFEGQFKSHTQCLQCKHEIVKFSPFLFLSLPLEEDHMRQLSVFVQLKGKLLLKCSVIVDKSGNVSNLCDQVRALLNVDVEFDVADVQGSCIYTLLRETTQLEDINHHDQLYLFQAAQYEDFLVEVIQRQNSSEWTLHGRKSKQMIFGHPIMVQFSALDKIDGISVYESVMHALSLAFNITNIINDSSSRPSSSKNSSQESLWKFVIRRVSSNGAQCSACETDKRCGGCVIASTDELISLKPYETLAVEWTSKKSSLILKTLEKIVEHPSLSNECKDNPSEATLDKIIRSYEKPEFMEASDFYCPACKGPREGIKRETVWRFPPCLMIQFKRFSYTVNGCIKNERSVTFPTKSFNVTPYLTPNAEGQHRNLLSLVPQLKRDNSHGVLPYAQKVTNDCNYDLYAVISHIGSFFDGHYISHWRNPQDQAWYLFNDHICKQEEFLQASIRSETAYLLFYQRQDVVDVKELKKQLIRETTA